MNELRACHICKDEYYGNSWGVELLDKVMKEEIVICFYCYYGQKERQFKEEWREKA